MKTRDALKYIMEQEGVNYGDLGERLGVTRQSIWESLNGKKSAGINGEQLIKIANLLGHRVYLVPDDVRKPTGAIEITSKEGEEQ